MNPKMVKRLQELQKENLRLKRLVADQALDTLILTHLGVSLEPPPVGQSPRSRHSRAVRLQRDRCGSAVDRAILASFQRMYTRISFTPSVGERVSAYTTGYG